MNNSSFFSNETKEWLDSLPGRKRRWQVTIFRSEPVEGGVKHVVVEHFNNVRSRGTSGCISTGAGELHFIDETGKEVAVSSMPFIAKETASEPTE